MSGGSLDYSYRHVEAAASTLLDIVAERLAASDKNETDATRLNLAGLQRNLTEVAKVLHAAEWYLSHDTGEDDFNQAFEKFVFQVKDDPSFRSDP